MKPAFRYERHLDNHIVPIVGLQVEVYDLRAQPSLHLFVHLVTRLHQLHSQIHVVPREAVVGPEGQCPREEADKVVLQKEREAQSGRTTLNQSDPADGQSGTCARLRNPYKQGR